MSQLRFSYKDLNKVKDFNIQSLLFYFAQVALHTITEENPDVIKARALFDWSAVQADNELTFSKGDIIIVTAQTDSAWWYGRKETGDGTEG